MFDRPDAAQPVRLKLSVTYDGTDFAGWAVQPGQRTVAGVIARALETLFRQPVPMVVAGRTDAGVHALAQVAHIDVDRASLVVLTPRDLRHQGLSQSSHAADPSDGSVTRTGLRTGIVGLTRRLAGLLPKDVRIPEIVLAPEGFDARFSALRRHYEYRIICTGWGLPPIGCADTLHSRRELDPERMHRAAQQLLGLHDFAAFCKPRERATTIRELQRLDVAGAPLRPGSAAAGAMPGSEIRIQVSADAFCHSMVRSLVGALIAVGEGRASERRPAELLAARTRSAEIAVAPARGLSLVGVDYPPDVELAARAARTRAVRSCDCEAE